MPEEWTPIDYALSAGALASIYADIQSTKKAVDSGSTEANPLIGGKPSKGKLNGLGALAAAAVLGGAGQMTPETRRPFLAGMMTMRAVVADQNKKAKNFKGFAEAMKKPIAAGLAGALLTHFLLGTDLIDNVAITPDSKVTIERKF